MSTFSKITCGLLFALLASTLSCAAKQSVRPLTPSTRATIQKSLNQWMKQQNTYRSLSSYAQVNVEARGRRESFDAAILLKAPDKAAIHILDDLGREQFRLIADGREVWWFDRRDGSYSRMPQEGRALEKALRLPLSVSEFIERLLAQVPEGEILGLVSGEASSEEVWEIVRGEDRLSMQNTPLLLRGFTALDPKHRNKTRYRVRYGEFVNDDGSPFPRSLHWSFRKPKVRVEIFLQDAELNSDPPDEKFMPTAAAGMY